MYRVLDMCLCVRLCVWKFGCEYEYAQAEFHFISFSLRIASLLGLLSMLLCSFYSLSLFSSMCPSHRADAHSFTYVTFYYISFIFVPLGLDEIVVAWAPSLELDLFFLFFLFGIILIFIAFSLSLFSYFSLRMCAIAFSLCLFMVSSCSRVQTQIRSWHWLIQFVS